MASGLSRAALTITVLALYLVAEGLHVLSAPALARRAAHPAAEVSEQLGSARRALHP